MDKLAGRLKAYIDTHPIDLGDNNCETVLDQLYQAYAESHESDPPEISNSFKELEDFLYTLPLDDNNAVFNHIFRYNMLFTNCTNQNIRCFTN